MRAAVVSVGLVVLITGCGRQRTVAESAPAPKPQEPTVAMTHQFAVPVLMYHRICDLTPDEARSPLMRDLSVPPAEFEAQLKFLREEGFTFLHVSEVERALRKGLPLPEKAVAITMDDGYQDNFTQALPLLEKYGAKATVFMVTNNFGRPARLSWPEAIEMRDRQVSFESHTVSHPDLRNLPEGTLRSELADSKSILEKGLKTPVTSLAYPAGEFNDQVVAMMEETGYFAGWKKGGGPVRPGDSADPYRLPRIRVNGDTDLDKFKKRVMSGVYVLAMESRASRTNS